MQAEENQRNRTEARLRMEAVGRYQARRCLPGACYWEPEADSVRQSSPLFFAELCLVAADVTSFLR